MDEFRQNNRLRGALDAALSGLNGDPALAQRVLRCAEEKPRAAKKLSVGLVFALVGPLRVDVFVQPRQQAGDRQFVLHGSSSFQNPRIRRAASRRSLALLTRRDAPTSFSRIGHISRTRS